MEDAIDRRHLFSAVALATAATALPLTATPAAAQAPASGDLLQQIKARGELRIGTPPGEPWFFKDQRSGEWKGIGWGAGLALARELGVKAVAVETTWGTAIAGLQANQFDVLFAMDATPQRALAIDFPVQPMFYYALGVLARDGQAAKTWADLDKPEVRIGVVLGTSPDRELTRRLPNAKIERFPNIDETGAAFVAGRVDAVSLFHPALVLLRSRVKRGSVVLPDPFRVASTSAGVRRDADKSWRDWVGVALNSLYETGEIQRIYEEFLTFRGIDPKDAPAIVRELWNKA
ncbi:transporter substrate-binding domain-containing protein [Prosthecomicrobium hirschii]|uniref:transporter substrate-binding domain-containing protein n=1 Tax=Prosthecodimorpha hirschii TaxID=665126 RepID=UPI00221EB8F9|nr:transporter substrate-binding domain-containing protein [Prosthecomicrobium hirschii]MCW1839597.1 transporter substrate-binding domain-containing protein [Prosthecomicrobium hirschii]